MLEKLSAFFLNFLWGKLVKELIPKLYQWLKNIFKSIEIKREVFSEEDEISLILQEIRIYMKAHPEAKRVPEDLETKLRVALRKRDNGLPDNI